MYTIRNLVTAAIACLLASAATANEPARIPSEPARASATDKAAVVRLAFGPTRKAKVAYLGVVISPVSSTLGRQLHLPEGTGLVVDFVAEATAAEKAGITQHDILTRLDDQILVNVPQLVVLVRLKDPGAKVALTLIREGKQRQVTAELGETERPAGAETLAFPMQNVALAPLDRTYPSRSAGGPASWVLGQLALESPSANARWVDGEHDLAVTLVTRLGFGLQAERLAEQMARLKGALARHRQTLPETHPTIRQLRDQIETLRVEMEARCRQPARSRHLVAKDLLGNVLFEGFIDTDEQLKAVPEAIRAKVKSMTPLVIFGPVPESPKR